MLEVVLALAIAIGLLVVVLYYYQQAARLRDATLGSASGLAAVRLCMDRLGTELRTASGQPATFRGGSQEIEFLRCDLPSVDSTIPDAMTVALAPPIALHRIRYALPTSEDPAAPACLVRTETPVAAPQRVEAIEEVPPVSPDTNDVWAVEASTVAEEGTRLTTSFPSSGTAALAIEPVRYLRLRYWDGATWQDSWTASELPRGVEVTLALNPTPADATPDTLPAEVFRRVIALPAGLTTAPLADPTTGFDDGYAGAKTIPEDGL